MKRISLTAALGAALLLAGCSSTSGTATANKSSSSVASSVASSAAVVSSLAPPLSSPSASDVASSAPASVASSAPAALGSSAPESSGGATASAGSDSSSVKSPATTVGDSKSSLDAASTEWFSAFCGGFGPVYSLAVKAGASMGGQGADLPKAQASLVGLYQTFGQAFTDTASKLQALPPPTFDGGSAFALKVVTALKASGPVFTADASKLKAIDVSKDPGSFATALSGLGASMATAMAPLADLGALNLTPQTMAAFEALPACAKLKAAAGG